MGSFFFLSACGGSSTSAESSKVSRAPKAVAAAIDAPVKGATNDDSPSTESAVLSELPASTPEEEAPSESSMAPTRPIPTNPQVSGELPEVLSESDSGAYRPKADPASSGVRPQSRTEKGYEHISFQVLSSFPYEEGRPIPNEILGLDNRKARLQGYMLPLELSDDQNAVISFLLMADQQGCCFGMMPEVNGWVVVHMKPGQTAPYVPDVPLFVEGDLSVGERYRQGALLGIYHLSADNAAALFS